ncbi:MAG: DUF3021 domain-containing protein [Aeriscardovia sp.]|nr:DUF3021 domain-containing protein [Aeriscardovia sp.]
MNNNSMSNSENKKARKEILVDLLRSTAISIGMAMTIFCLVGMGFDLSLGGDFHLTGYQFTRMVLGCLLVGLGFGVPTIVYRKDNLPMPIRILIHMGTGCTIYTLVAYAVGWMGASTNPVQGILIALSQLAIAFLIWFLFMKHYRREAKELNEKIQSLKNENGQ